MASLRVKINSADSIRFVQGEDVPFTVRVQDLVTGAPLPQPWTITILFKKQDASILEVPITATDYVAGVGTGEISAAQSVLLPTGNDQTAELKYVNGSGKILYAKLAKFFSVEARALA